MLEQTQNPPLAIDARMLDREGTGVATYARALHHALGLLAGPVIRVADPGCSGPMRPARTLARWARWTEALVDRPRRLRHATGGFRARDIFRLAQVHFDRHHAPLRLYAPGPAGIVHWTYPLPVRIEGWINIYTIHDAIPLVHPALSSIDPQRHYRLLTMLARSAEHMLTVSEAARHDIIAALGCDPDAISACPPGLEIATPAVPLPPGLTPGGYMLFVGSVEPRKNLLRLADAHRRSGLAMPLVIAGPDGWRAEEITPLLDDMPGLIRIRYMPRTALVALIAGARALLFPTLAEGFGLPIAEAMGLGTPVLTSRGGATEEIAGGAALLADPLSVEELAGQLGRLNDPATHGSLVERGLRRAEMFTPAAFARRLDAIHARMRHGGQSPIEPLGAARHYEDGSG